MYSSYFLLQISNSLLSRVATVDQNFYKEMDLIPRVSPEFELTLDTSPVIHSIQTMNFFQMKGKIATFSSAIFEENVKVLS